MATKKTASKKNATQETPFQTMKRLYGDKAKLVDKAVAIAKDAGDETSEAKERLAGASNAKLIRLINVGEAIKSEFGSRPKMITAIGDASGKSKDKDFLNKLATLSSGELLDLARAKSSRKSA